VKTATCGSFEYFEDTPFAVKIWIPAKKAKSLGGRFVAFHALLVSLNPTAFGRATLIGSADTA